ncbi:MAG: hypothetical protein AAFY16_09055 [Cyanobacteria bacterium J06642_3]
MPRRNIHRKSATEVELFPFLSVLACTIGTLILLIIVLTTQALEPQEAVVVAKTDENSRGANRDKTPAYIECREDGFILHPSKEFAPRADLYDEQSPLREMIANLQQNKDEQYLIVILRPDGLEMFDKVRELIQEKGIDIGYEPLEYGIELQIAS